MQAKVRTDLEYFVSTGKEFGYLKAISKLGNKDYLQVINHSLDMFNYYKKLKVSTYESKVQALYLSTKFCKR